MTFLAVVSVAAVCASFVWYERRVVSKRAVQRCVQRRSRKAWDRWDDLMPSTDVPTRRLSGAIETAIFAGDSAFAYRDRLEPGMTRGESPFQFRRSRIDASVRRYDRSVEHVVGAASRWLDAATEQDDHRQTTASVHSLLTILEEHQSRAKRRDRDDMGRIDVTIDVLENALANLQRDQAHQMRGDPFR